MQGLPPESSFRLDQDIARLRSVAMIQHRSCSDQPIVFNFNLSTSTIPLPSGNFSRTCFWRHIYLTLFYLKLLPQVFQVTWCWMSRPTIFFYEFWWAHSFLAEDGSVPFLNLRVTGVRVEAQQVNKVLPPPVAFLYARYCTIINALALSGLLVESKWGFLNMCSIYISSLTRNIHSLQGMDSFGLFVPRGGSFCKEMNALTLSA